MSKDLAGREYVQSVTTYGVATSDQPSPSKWAVEGAQEWSPAWRGKDRMELAALIDRAISSALAEQAKVLGEVEAALGQIDAIALVNPDPLVDARAQISAVAVVAQNKLRSLKR